MPEFTPGQQALLSAWGSIQAAIGDPALRSRPGGATQAAWEAYKQFYISRGLEPPKATIQDMNKLAGMAGAQARTTQNLAEAISTFQRTGIDQMLTPAMWAPDINSRDITEQPLGPNFTIRFTANFSLAGEPLQKTYTWRPGLQVPQSVAGLLDGLEQAALGAADDYGLEFESLSDFASITTY